MKLINKELLLALRQDAGAMVEFAPGREDLPPENETNLVNAINESLDSIEEVALKHASPSINMRNIPLFWRSIVLCCVLDDLINAIEQAEGKDLRSN